MSGQNTCVAELSCADGPLSTTGSVIGTVAPDIAFHIGDNRDALSNPNYITRLS